MEEIVAEATRLDLQIEIPPCRREDARVDVNPAIPADSFARAVVFAMSQPDDVDINEILFRPTRQEL